MILDLLLGSPKTSITDEHHLPNASVQLLATSRTLKKESLIIASFDSSFGNCKSFALSTAQVGILSKHGEKETEKGRLVKEITDQCSLKLSIKVLE